MKNRSLAACPRLRLAALLLLAASPLAPGRADAAQVGGSWPQFHGPARDNLSTETGLLKEWPKDGPPLLWTFPDCGKGYAAPSIADGRLFTSGDFADKECVLALGLDGKLLWKTPNGPSWKGAMPGARTTPTVHDGLVYHLNPTGRLAALRADSGQEAWAVDLKEQFRLDPGTWALAENLVLEGDAVLAAPGGPLGRVVALDRKTGRLLWANTEIQEAAAYCSPIVVTHAGVRQFITLTYKSIVSVDVQTGKLLWSHPHPTQYGQNVTTPVYKDGFLHVTSGHGMGSRLLQLAPDGRSVREVWASKDLDNCHGGVVLLDGRLYGSGCRLFGRGVVCVDFRTGQTLANNKALGKVSITYADGRLYCLSDKARLTLVEPHPQECRVLGQFQVPSQTKELSLSHPVVCGGRLYIRHWTDLLAYHIAAAPPEGR